MPEWLILSLLVVFVIHLALFVRLALKKKEGYYWLVSTTFFLLVLSFSSRLWFESIIIFGIPVYWFPRIAAWMCTAVAVTFAIRRKMFSHRTAQEETSG
jgi:hypothetical protein